MSLQSEIDSKAKEIQADSYSMSIGELINMYKDDEIEIHPDFQRYFRWSNAQKSKFIESILLGIPIPPIFVSQGEEGVWDVIDGLQRLSTIFEFVGILKDNQNKVIPPSLLQATKFLPSLENKFWENKDDEINSFTRELRINFKRAKLEINIIKKSSDKDAKYELFQRINSGGTELSAQELRNCLLIMLDKEFYHFCQTLCSFEAFQNCVPLSEKLTSERYDMEIVMRYLVYRYSDPNQIKGNEDIHDFITDQIVKIIEEKTINYDQETEIFKKTFTFLDKLLSEDAFKKYYPTEDRFKGAFLIKAFEAIIVGFSENINSLNQKEDNQVLDMIKGIYESEAYLDATSRNNNRPVGRLRDLITYSRKVFE